MRRSAATDATTTGRVTLTVLTDVAVRAVCLLLRRARGGDSIACVNASYMARSEGLLLHLQLGVMLLRES